MSMLIWLKKLVDRYKKHSNKHVYESAKMTAELFSDSFGRSVEEFKTKVYRDSISGLDIDLHPTSEKPDEMVKKNLSKSLKDNKVAKLMGLSCKGCWKNLWWYLF